MNLRPDPARLAARLPRRTVRLRLTALYGGLFLASGHRRCWPSPTSWPAAWPGPCSTPSHRHRTRSGARPSHTAGAPHACRRRSRPRQLHQHAAALNHLLAVSAIALGIMAIASVALGWLVAGRVLRPLREMTAAARAISEDNLHQRLAVPGPGDELKDLGDTIDSLLDRLQAAFDAQRNFVASASHELRTPLTLTRTLLQMALTDPHPTLASYRSTCQDLLEASDQQEQLIEALLTLARSQRGLDHRDPLDLAAITRDALEARRAGRRRARAGHRRLDSATAPVAGRRPAPAAAGHQPDRQRDPPQHPRRPDQHPSHRRRGNIPR